MKRLFLAIPINQEYLKICLHFTEQHDKLGYNWIKPENWHITLIFMGNFSEKLIPSLNTCLVDFFSQINPFDLCFDGFFYKPNKGHPRMLWAGFQQSHAFDELVQSANQVLFEFYRQKQTPFDINTRKINIPHITLCRLGKGKQTPGNLENKQQNVKNLKVQVCHLFESVLLPKGAKYHLLHSFSLNPTNNL
jgi:2'-5' RNA ligase